MNSRILDPRVVRNARQPLNGNGVNCLYLEVYEAKTPRKTARGLTAHQWEKLARLCRIHQEPGRYRKGITGLRKAIRASRAWCADRVPATRDTISAACDFFGVPLR